MSSKILPGKENVGSEINSNIAPFLYGTNITNPRLPEKDKLGTTIIAVVYDGGVMLGADGRQASSYISNRVSDKIEQITKNIYALKCGTSADSQFLLQNTRNYMNQFAVEYGDKAPVKVASRILQQFMYQYKKYLSSSFIVAGVDNVEGACIYTCSKGGTVAKREVAMNGSGSVYINGYVDKHFKSKMTKQEAKEFIKEAITLAIFRDNSSGGNIRIVDITEDGVTREIFPFNTLKFPNMP